MDAVQRLQQLQEDFANSDHIRDVYNTSIAQLRQNIRSQIANNIITTFDGENITIKNIRINGLGLSVKGSMNPGKNYPWKLDTCIHNDFINVLWTICSTIEELPISKELNDNNAIVINGNNTNLACIIDSNTSPEVINSTTLVNNQLHSPYAYDKKYTPLSSYEHHDVFDIMMTVKLHKPYIERIQDINYAKFSNVEFIYEGGEIFYSSSEIMSFEELEHEYYKTEKEKEVAYEQFCKQVQ